MEVLSLLAPQRLAGIPLALRPVPGLRTGPHNSHDRLCWCETRRAASTLPALVYRGSARASFAALAPRFLFNPEGTVTSAMEKMNRLGKIKEARMKSNK